MTMQANMGGAANLLGSNGRVIHVANQIARRRPYLNSRGQAVIVQNGKQQRLTTNNENVLPRDAWRDIDRTVVRVRSQRLVGIQDLITRGLVHNLPHFGITISLWQEMSDMTEANISMSGMTQGEKDRHAFKERTVPVPIVHKDFEMPWRYFEAGRNNMFVNVQTEHVATSTRLVAEKSEDMLFQGTPITAEGGTIYGYTNHPSRIQVDLATPWDELNQADNDKILQDVRTMLEEVKDDHFHTSFVLYVPSGWEMKLEEDFAGGAANSSNLTVRERLLRLPGLEAIRAADRLPANNAVLVHMEIDTVDLAMASDIVTVQWSSPGGWVENFKTMAVWVPRLKVDYDGRMGVVHLRSAS